MTAGNPFTTLTMDSAKMVNKALAGAAVAYVLITLFLFVAGVHTDPSWPKFWMVRPLLMVPLAGATGGVFFHFMHTLRQQKGWNKILVNILCLIVYIVGLWMGTILGLDGTLWD